MRTNNSALIERFRPSPCKHAYYLNTIGQYIFALLLRGKQDAQKASLCTPLRLRTFAISLWHCA
jgi:hypothetical protein